jgi:hypothetical protein
VGQAQLLAHRPHLVLEQQAEGLDQVEGQVVGEAADVVVGLDGRRAVRSRLDDVGVERALDQVAGRLMVAGSPGAGRFGSSLSMTRSRATSSKMRMNSSPMILRLASGSVTPARASKKRSAAFTWTRSMWNWRRKVSSTCSLSWARIRPVST